MSSSKRGMHPWIQLKWLISKTSNSLGYARFLKTVKCRHKRGFLVVKIFVKPDPGISLRTYHRRLKGVYPWFSRGQALGLVFDIRFSGERRASRPSECLCLPDFRRDE